VVACLITRERCYPRVKASRISGGMTTFIALLRGINVGGNRKLAMGALRDLCAQAGLANVRSYVNSGNLVFDGTGSAAAQEKRLEAAIAEHAGFKVDVMVRTAKQWSGYVRGNPFPELSEKHPSRVMLIVAKEPIGDDAVEKLREKASGEERVEKTGEVLWIYFAQGAGRSKLAAVPPGPITVTARNWRTVLKLDEMARESGPAQS
jgi:uncharacterized protein (DUF1697 family)